MNRNRLLTVIGLVILVLIGGWYITNMSHKGLTFEMTQSGDKQHTETTDLYTVQIVYPDKTSLAVRSGKAAESRAEAAIQKVLQEQIDAFKQAIDVNGLSQEEKTRISTVGPKFSLNIGYHAYSSGSFVSYEFDIFMDTGGAHPANLYKTLVLDLQGKPVELKDLFVSNADYLGVIASKARPQIEAQLKRVAGAEATSTILADGIAPKDENFSNFVVDSDRIRIFIPPAQAAASAAGAFELQIPLTEIKDILKPGIN